jgi:ATP-dependent DNA helicase RecG
LLAALKKGPLSRSALAKQLGHTTVSGGLKRSLRHLMQVGKIVHTLPDKPNSRLQKYRLP